MDDEFVYVARDDEAIHVAEFQPARFHAELGLPLAACRLSVAQGCCDFGTAGVP